MHYIQYIRDLTSKEVRNAETAVLTGNYQDAENILLQVSKRLNHRFDAFKGQKWKYIFETKVAFTPMHFMLSHSKNGLFLFIFVLFKQFYRIKTVDFSGIRTWIVGIEGKHADHLTRTTTAYAFFFLPHNTK